MEDSYPIERGIPMGRFPGRPFKYPWPKMKVGDSFFVAEPIPVEKIQTRLANVSRSYIQRHRNRAGMEFATRQLTENGVTGVRVWRVK